MPWNGSNIDCLTDNPSDIIGQLDRLRIAGCKLIRWQLVNDARAMANWSVEQYAEWLGNRYWILDQCAPFLMQHAMPVILDFHHPIGGLKDGKWRAFYDDHLMDWHVHWCEGAAERYKDNPVVFALEPFNEPHPRSDAQLHNAYARIIDAIKGKGWQKHIVVDHKTAKIENISKLKFLPFTNILYSAHLWPDWSLDPNSRKRTITKSYVRDLLKPAIEWEKRSKHHLAAHNSSMFLGEFGCHYKSGKGQNFLPYCKAVASVANDLNWMWAWLGTCHYDHHAFRATQDELNQIIGGL